jgi:hypothetical protein
MFRISGADGAKKAVKLTTYAGSRSAQFPSHGFKKKKLIILRGIQQFGSSASRITGL